MPGTMTGGLDESVRAHLAQLFHLTHNLNDTELAELARAELPRLISALKIVLDGHQADGYGHCLVCQPGRRRHRLPFELCQAYDSAQRFLAVERENISPVVIRAQNSALNPRQPKHALHN